METQKEALTGAIALSANISSKEVLKPSIRRGTGPCTFPCLNGGHCVHPDSCNCSLYQATGSRCQTVANTGFEREMTCRSWGQYNYETFDGLYYHFPGKCSYTLVRDCEDTSQSSVIIQVHNDPECSSAPYSCARSVSLFLPWEGEVRLQKSTVTFKGQNLELPHNIHDVEMERISQYVLVTQQHGFTLAWDDHTSSVYIKMSPEYVGRTCGLCGNFNADVQDDLRTSYGLYTQDLAMFGNSWAEVEPQQAWCPTVPYLYPSPCSAQDPHTLLKVREVCDMLLVEPFKACHEFVSPLSYMASCSNDLCLSGPNGDVVCRVLTEYARACAHAEHPLDDWREHITQCAMECADELVYRECITCCPVSCNVDRMCIDSKLQCLDGCYCPDDLIYEGGSCVKASDCPCEYHGMVYPSGQMVQEECNNCTCLGGVWNCTEYSCPGECSVTGDIHFHTFDGRMYTFPATCQYVLAKSRNSGRFTITVQNSPCGPNLDGACIQSVNLILDEDPKTEITMSHSGEVFISSQYRISLPYSDEVFHIQELSSMFLQVRAVAQGLRLQYNWREFRLYLQVDPLWKEDTVGLCGTFNGNIQDDFLSPSGMIESTPQLFGNSWRLSSACVPSPSLPQLDPCDTHQQAASYAAEMCDILNQDLFASCHEYLSPALFHRQCRGDTCKCGQPCLCSALAHYARQCRKHGVIVEFRARVSECAPLCPATMEYGTCVSSCQHRCSALSSPQHCDEECEEGCVCPSGTFYSSRTHTCVERSQCPCSYLGAEYSPGDVIMSSAGVQVCQDGRMVSQSSIIDKMCPPGQHYLDCDDLADAPASERGLACEQTCESHLLNLTCSAHEPCVPGCACPPGLLKHGDECFQPEACPCFWKGKEYYPGDKVTSPCHRCVCQHGSFQCVFQPCPSMCTAYGDRHYRTFDGLLFDYIGACKVYLVKSSVDLTLSVTSENVDCYDSGVICRKSLLINIGKSVIAFDDESGKPNPSSLIDRSKVVLIWRAGYFTILHVPEEDITVLWDRKTTVHIQAGPRWQGKLSGLCGNFDMKTVNEMRTPENMDSATSQEFGNSWTAAECINSPDIRHPCSLSPLREPFAKRQCGILLSEVFEICHPVVDVTWFYMNCLMDTCSCSRGGDCECFCTSVSAYAHRCCQEGVAVDWRSPAVCPYDCEFYNKVLGKGPYKLVTYRDRDTALAANTSGGVLFPLRRAQTAAGITALFMMTPGLSRARPHDSSLVSFEAAGRPNYFVRAQRGGQLELAKFEERGLFSDQATFVLHRDTWISGYDSLESFARPGFFLHYTRSRLHLMKYNHSDGFRRATLFRLTGFDLDTSLWPRCQWRYESCVSACFRTCSDPSGQLCTTIPKVEGCIPQCPGHMVLDEVTQRCVHLADCIKPPVAVAPTPPHSTAAAPAAVTSTAAVPATAAASTAHSTAPGISTAHSAPPTASPETAAKETHSTSAAAPAVTEREPSTTATSPTLTSQPVTTSTVTSLVPEVDTGPPTPAVPVTPGTSPGPPVPPTVSEVPVSLTSEKTSTAVLTSLAGPTGPTTVMLPTTARTPMEPSTERTSPITPTALWVTATTTTPTTVSEPATTRTTTTTTPATTSKTATTRTTTTPATTSKTATTRTTTTPATTSKTATSRTTTTPATTSETATTLTTTTTPTTASETTTTRTTTTTTPTTTAESVTTTSATTTTTETAITASTPTPVSETATTRTSTTTTPTTTSETATTRTSTTTTPTTTSETATTRTSTTTTPTTTSETATTRTSTTTTPTTTSEAATTRTSTTTTPTTTSETATTRTSTTTTTPTTTTETATTRTTTITTPTMTSETATTRTSTITPTTTSQTATTRTTTTTTPTTTSETATTRTTTTTTTPMTSETATTSAASTATATRPVATSEITSSTTHVSPPSPTMGLSTSSILRPVSTSTLPVPAASPSEAVTETTASTAWATPVYTTTTSTPTTIISETSRFTATTTETTHPTTTYRETSAGPAVVETAKTTMHTTLETSPTTITSTITTTEAYTISPSTPTRTLGVTTPKPSTTHLTESATTVSAFTTTSSTTPGTSPEVISAVTSERHVPTAPVLRTSTTITPSLPSTTPVPALQTTLSSVPTSPTSQPPISTRKTTTAAFTAVVTSTTTTVRPLTPSTIATTASAPPPVEETTTRTAETQPTSTATTVRTSWITGVPTTESTSEMTTVHVPVSTKTTAEDWRQTTADTGATTVQTTIGRPVSLEVPRTTVIPVETPKSTVKFPHTIAATSISTSPETTATETTATSTVSTSPKKPATTTIPTLPETPATTTFTTFPVTPSKTTISTIPETAATTMSITPVIRTTESTTVKAPTVEAELSTLPSTLKITETPRSPSTQTLTTPSYLTHKVSTAAITSKPLTVTPYPSSPAEVSTATSEITTTTTAKPLAVTSSKVTVSTSPVSRVTTATSEATSILKSTRKTTERPEAATHSPVTTKTARTESPTTKERETFTTHSTTKATTVSRLITSTTKPLTMPPLTGTIGPPPVTQKVEVPEVTTASTTASPTPTSLHTASTSRPTVTTTPERYTPRMTSTTGPPPSTRSSVGTTLSRTTRVTSPPVPLVTSTKTTTISTSTVRTSTVSTSTERLSLSTRLPPLPTTTTAPVYPSTPVKPVSVTVSTTRTTQRSTRPTTTRTTEPPPTTLSTETTKTHSTPVPSLTSVTAPPVAITETSRVTITLPTATPESTVSTEGVPQTDTPPTESAKTSVPDWLTSTGPRPTDEVSVPPSPTPVAVTETAATPTTATTTSPFTPATDRWWTTAPEMATPSAAPHTTEVTTTTTTTAIPSTRMCTPPYSEIIDECTKYICVGGQLMLFNKSQNCPYNSIPPNCGLLGFAVLVNGDKCCPQWDCPCRCSLFPDLNVITFDGNSVAIYKAASYIVTELPDETVSIQVQECQTSDTPLWNFTSLCLVALNITHKSNQVLINRLQRRLYVNSRYAKPRFRKYGYEVLDTGNMYLIRTPAGLKIQWFHSTGMMVVETDGYGHKLSTMGLCGCCDGNPANDLTLSNGTTVGEGEDPALFIDSWQVPNTTVYVSQSRRREVNCSTSDCSECLDMLSNHSFASCHAFVPPTIFCEVWVRDAEYVKNPCVALAAYVASCHKFNICIEWRSPDYCPFSCPDELRYQACLPACTAQTCPSHELDSDPEDCSGLTEGCVCPEGTLLHRPYSALCIPAYKCACTDSFGNPRSSGEVWKASKDGCCMYKCDNDTIVPMEYNCSSVPQPVCRRAGEVTVSLADDRSCCPRKACVCNQTLCDTYPPECKYGEKLVSYYREDSCCPDYVCECDPNLCESDIPACREDQTLIATRADGSCCLAHICMCAACADVTPECQEGEVLTVDANSTDRCCPTYHCVCEPYRCTGFSCPEGMSEVSVAVPEQCCPLRTCECSCETIKRPKCDLGETMQLDRAFIADPKNQCGCKKYKCERDAVCVDGERGVMRPGQTLVEHSAEGVCYTTQCTSSLDPHSGFYRIRATSTNCSAQCQQNQIYIPPNDQTTCCGVCKNISCLYQNENGSISLSKPGETWVSQCTKYECAATLSGPTLVSYSFSCPPFNETECTKIGGTIISYMDGCCKTCKEDGKSCQKVTVRMTIRKNDCRSNRPVNIVSCDGKCPSASIYNYNINTYARFCKCCRELGLQRRSVQLYCSGNSTWVSYSIQEPTDCSCQWS
ncbi:otogelin [Anguilla anguilla]|uniref:otogelin n=1 Tax=Anguilla anguilla TaxID=7936 RepID=UPI0015A9E497|nr:otogelin [Anguilla anguilla]